MSTKQKLSRFRRRIKVTFSLLFTILAVVCGLAYYSSYHMLDAYTWLTNARIATLPIIQVSNDVGDAKNAEMGYILTQDQSYLDTYLRSMVELTMNRAEMEKKVRNRDQRGDVIRVSRMIDAAVTDSSHVVILQQKGYHEEALRAISRGDGEKVAVTIRSVLSQMWFRERDRSLAHQKQWESSVARLAILSAVLVVCAFTLFLFIARRVVVRFEEAYYESMRVEEESHARLLEMEAQHTTLTHLRESLEKEVEEHKAAERALSVETQSRQQFLVDVLYSITDGKFHLCDDVTRLPSGGLTLVTPIALTEDNISDARHELEKAAESLQYPQGRIDKVMSAAGEALINAVVHGDQGTISASLIRDTLYVTVSDKGTGIDVAKIPSSVFQSGFSSLGRQSMGLGFTLIIAESDEVYLYTGKDGTTISMCFGREYDFESRFAEMLMAEKY